MTQLRLNDVLGMRGVCRAVKRDRVKVLHAEHHASHHVGHTGIVIGVDHETDCIIKMDSGDMCIVDVSHMAKLAVQG